MCGGHHLHGMNLGDGSENRASAHDEFPTCTTCPCVGLPRISVNLSNFNVLVQDTEFAYGGRGPTVELTRTYNADDPRESAFGH